MHLLVGAAEGCGGWRGHAYPCAVTGHAMLRHGVGVGAGFLRGVLCQKDERLRISVGAVGCDVRWVWVWVWFGGGWIWIVAFCRWHQCGIKVGLCAGRVGAMPLLSLGMGGRVSNVGWGITKVATQNCAHYLVVRCHAMPCHAIADNALGQGSFGTWDMLPSTSMADQVTGLQDLTQQTSSAIFHTP